MSQPARRDRGRLSSKRTGIHEAPRSFTDALYSIASFSGDLSSLTAPPFILSPVSLTEFPAYWCERPELFSAIADAPGPEERSLAVLKWFICTLKDQYTSRNESMGSEKKCVSCGILHTRSFWALCKLWRWMARLRIGVHGLGSIPGWTRWQRCHPDYGSHAW